MPGHTLFADKLEHLIVFFGSTTFEYMNKVKAVLWSVWCLTCMIPVLPYGCKTSEEKEPEVQAGHQQKRIDIVMPSPAQIAAIYKKAGLKYVKGMTIPVDKYSPVSTPAKRIFYGMVAADMAYAMINRQSNVSLSLARKLRELTAELEPEITQQVDSLLSKYEKIAHNMDSIYYMLAKIQEQLDMNIELYQRYSSRVIYFAGGWIESMYLGAMTSDTSNVHLNSLIMEQFTFLGNLLKALNEIPEKNELTGVIYALQELERTFSQLPEVSSRPDTVSLSQVRLSHASREHLKEAIRKLRESVLSSLS